MAHTVDQKFHLPEEFLVKAREISSCYFHFVLEETTRLFPSARKKKTCDLYHRFDGSITEMREGTTLMRLLYTQLLFIKQHSSLLRHMTISDPGITPRDVIKALALMEDLLVGLSLLHKYEGIASQKLAGAIYRYYALYYDLTASITDLHPKVYRPAFCSEADLPKLFFDVEGKFIFPEPLPLPVAPVSSTSSSQDEPPEGGHDIAWYKRNGHIEFLLKQVVIPRTTEFADAECLLISHNGNNFLFRRLSDTKTKYLKRDVVLDFPVERDTVETLPTKGYTLRWYKDNGYGSTLFDWFIIPRGGDFIGNLCTVVKYGCTRTLFARVLDPSKTAYIKDDVLIELRPKE